MASVSFDPEGVRVIFYLDGERKQFRLGHASKTTARTIAGHVTSIVAARRFGTTLDGASAAWLGEIDDTLHGRVAATGLVAPRRRGTLGKFVAAFIAGRTDVTARTRLNDQHTEKQLAKFFGDVPLEQVTADDAEKFRRWLDDDRFSRATTGRIIKRARQFFAAAIRAGLVERNPFAGVKAYAQVNADRKRHIDLPMTERMMNAAGSARWRLIIALSRFGGMRCPSEHLSLRWADIDWTGGRIAVSSPKTGKREIPLFLELRTALDDMRQLTGEVGHVLTGPAGFDTNFRTGLKRIIKRAGLTEWPRLFHNLRASRQTELCQHYPLHVVCAWLGNSAPIADRHYLTVRDEDFAKAATKPATSPGAESANQGVEADSAAPKRPIHAGKRRKGKDSLPPRGSEPGSNGEPESAATLADGNKGGNMDGLALVSARWSTLAAAVRRKIVALVRAACLLG